MKQYLLLVAIFARASAMQSLSPTQLKHYKRMLKQALYDNNVEEVRSILKRSQIDLNKIKLNTAEGESSPLKWALEYGQADMLECLLDFGADPNKKIIWYGTALMCCTYHNKDIGMMKLLVRAGADILAINYFGSTVLTRVACYGDVRMLRSLIKLGAAQNKSELTRALHAAISCYKDENAKYLLRCGADIYARDPETGRDAFHFAARYTKPFTRFLLYWQTRLQVSSNDKNVEFDTAR